MLCSFNSKELNVCSFIEHFVRNHLCTTVFLIMCFTVECIQIFKSITACINIEFLSSAEVFNTILMLWLSCEVSIILLSNYCVEYGMCYFVCIFYVISNQEVVKAIVGVVSVYIDTNASHVPYLMCLWYCAASKQPWTFDFWWVEALNRDPSMLHCLCVLMKHCLVWFCRWMWRKTGIYQRPKWLSGVCARICAFIQRLIFKAHIDIK